MELLGFSPSVKIELCHDVPCMYYLEDTRQYILYWNILWHFYCIKTDYDKFRYRSVILNNTKTFTETTVRQQEAHKDFYVLCLCAQALKHVYTFVRRACYGPSLLQSCLTVELYPTERHHCWAAGSGISPVQHDSPQHSLPGGSPHHLQHHNSSSCINVAYCGS